MRRESPLAASAAWSGEKALFGVTLCTNEPCLKGRAYKRFGNFLGGQGSPRAAREPGAPQGCSGGMPKSPRPGSRGTRAQSRQGSRPCCPVAVLQEHKLSHQDPPHTFCLSSPGSLRALPATTPSPAPAQPPRGGVGGVSPPPPPPGQPSPGFRPALTGGTSCLYGRGYRFARTEPPTRGSWAGSGGRAFLVSCGKPGSKRSRRVQRPGRLRRLGSIFCFCGGHAVGLTYGLQNTQAGTSRPIPRLSLCSQGFLSGCLGAVAGSAAGAGAGQTRAPPQPSPTRG